jgi:outer membrane lipoprotein-sorting protein
MRRYLFLGLMVGSLMVSGEARAGLTAKQIIDKAMKHSYLGKDGSQAKVRMTLTNRRGAQRVRTLLIWSQRKAKRTRSLVRITAPPDVRGTSFLFKENAAGQDDMWLYIPALKRTRRIVGKARQGRFLGSDFTYADLEARGLKGAAHKRLADSKISRFACYVIEAKPKSGSGSAYSRIVAWIRKDNFVAIRLKMYDKGGKLIKKLFVRRLGRNAAGIPIIKETRMKNVQQRSSTLMRVLSTKSLAGVGAGLFTVRNLARGL